MLIPFRSRPAQSIEVAVHLGRVLPTGPLTPFQGKAGVYPKRFGGLGAWPPMGVVLEPRGTARKGDHPLGLQVSMPF